MVVILIEAKAAYLRDGTCNQSGYGEKNVKWSQVAHRLSRVSLCSVVFLAPGFGWQQEEAKESETEVIQKSIILCFYIEMSYIF